MNVLLTCAGRRNLLVKIFKDAVGKDGQVLACDASAAAPALVDADRSFIVPSMHDPAYVDTLLRICRDERVGLLVSVNDLELGSLAASKGRFRDVGTVALVSSQRVIARCQDKWAAYHWLRNQEIATPRTYLSCADALQGLNAGEVRWPLLVKPRWGTSSIGVERVENERELHLAHEWGRVQVGRSIVAALGAAVPESCMLVQEWLDGEEHGLDIVNDLNGRHVAVLARRKLAMRAGNTDRAVTVADASLDRLGADIGTRLGHVGVLDCDVIRDERGDCVIDLNPRFGGGYPFSHLAGANLPAAFVAWTRGATPCREWLRAQSGVLISKCDDLRVIESTVHVQSAATAEPGPETTVAELTGRIP